ILRSASWDCRHCVMARPALTSLQSISASLLQTSFIVAVLACFFVPAFIALARRSLHPCDRSASWSLRHCVRSLAVFASGQNCCSSAVHALVRCVFVSAASTGVLHTRPLTTSPRNAIHATCWNRFVLISPLL